MHFDLLLFCPILASKISFNLYFQHCAVGTLLYAYYSVTVNGNYSAETRFKKYSKLTENSTKKPRKITPKNKSGFEKKLTRFFFHFKNEAVAKMRLRKYWVCSEILKKKKNAKFLFFNGFRQFLSKFSIFINTVFSDETSINCDRILCTISFNFLHTFSTVFRRFLRAFPIFLKMGFSAEIPIYVTE